jgi:hypothetical protein
MTTQSAFKYFKTLPKTIRFAVRYFVRYLLSFHQVEDVLHERGIDISVSIAFNQKPIWRGWVFGLARYLK